ncbi:MAG: ATP-binding protein [Cyanobacteria bacterium P01_G01_bin.49]
MPQGWKQKSTATMEPTIEAKTQPDTSAMEQIEVFKPEQPTRSLDELIVPANVRSQIEVALNRIRYHKVLYYEWNLRKVDPQGSRVAINFFGPPGTGKTFGAEAIANYLGKQIIKVNYAEIESKYVGETPKQIKAGFARASETGAVLFFDEADAILGKRLTNITQSADHGVNVSRAVMLLELDNFDGIVIFASNLPRNYDGAFVRRILAHIEFELPDISCLKKLWEYLLPVEVPRANDVTPEWLAQQSTGLAGGDILNVVRLATSSAVSRIDGDRFVIQSDIEEAMIQVRSGKEKIGSSTPIIKERIIPTEKLPSDVKDDYQKVVSQDKE